MIETPEIVETPAQDIAYIPVVVPRADIMKVMGPGLQELMRTLASQGIAPAGPWFTHHLRLDPEVFDFEICIPVRTPVTSQGRVRAGKRPKMKVVRTVHHGPYEEFASAWNQFNAWISRQGIETTEDLWECYPVGPESSSDPSDWCSEFIRPLRKQ